MSSGYVVDPNDEILCTTNEPPMVDFANVQSKALDLINFDIKIPERAYGVRTHVRRRDAVLLLPPGEEDR